MPTPKHDFSAFVKKVREQLGISQEDLARELGVSYATVNRWENGQCKPSKLAKAQFESFCSRMSERGNLSLPASMLNPLRTRRSGQE